MDYLTNDKAVRRFKSRPSWPMTSQVISKWSNIGQLIHQCISQSLQVMSKSLGLFVTPTFLILKWANSQRLQPLPLWFIHVSLFPPNSNNRSLIFHHLIKQLKWGASEPVSLEIKCGNSNHAAMETLWSFRHMSFGSGQLSRSCACF